MVVKHFLPDYISGIEGTNDFGQSAVTESTLTIITVRLITINTRQ